MTPASHAGGPEFEPRTVYSIGRVAQMAERRSNKPSVEGSIPSVTIFLESPDRLLALFQTVLDHQLTLFSQVMVLWCNWLALWTLNPAIRVQIPVGPFYVAW